MKPTDSIGKRIYNFAYPNLQSTKKCNLKIYNIGTLEAVDSIMTNKQTNVCYNL